VNALEDKRDIQQRKDLSYILQSQECKMNEQQGDFIRTLFCWGDLFNSLDRCINEDLIRQNPLRLI